MVLNCEIHKKVFIYVYLHFKSEFKENYLALTSLKIPLTGNSMWDGTAVGKQVMSWDLEKKALSLV